MINWIKKLYSRLFGQKQVGKDSEIHYSLVTRVMDQLEKGLGLPDLEPKKKPKKSKTKKPKKK
jgi:hypothetical protein